MTNLYLQDGSRLATPYVVVQTEEDHLEARGGRALEAEQEPAGTFVVAAVGAARLYFVCLVFCVLVFWLGGKTRHVREKIIVDAKMALKRKHKNKRCTRTHTTLPK